MSAPRVAASFLALSAAVVMVSCGEQSPPTRPSAMANATAGIQAGATEFFEMLADPAGPRLATRDDEGAPPIVYAPGTPPDPWPPEPAAAAAPGVPVPDAPTESAAMHIKVDPEPV